MIVISVASTLPISLPRTAKPFPDERGRGSCARLRTHGDRVRVRRHLRAATHSTSKPGARRHRGACVSAATRDRSCGVHVAALKPGITRGANRRDPDAERDLWRLPGGAERLSRVP